jgi:aldehyde dehydrogenase (NAD+)
LRNRLFIDGQWLDSVSGARFETIDPATEEILTDVPRADAEDVDHAVRAAYSALRGPWQRLSPAERGTLLLRWAREVETHREELARLETLDVGKPLSLSAGETSGVVKTLEFNAGATDKIYGDTIPLDHDHINFTRLEPLGVTAHIVPWNSPMAMTIRSVAPALAAGCTVVIKPAEQSPLSTLRLAELAQAAGIPDGIVNVVTGYGPEAGAALIAHPLVRGVTFTGSVETGRQVMAQAAQGIKPVVLELGGKSPLIVFPDADLDRAAADAARGFLTNCGQVCVAATRLIVHRDIESAFMERLRARVEAVTIGPGMDDPDLGPLISADQYRRVTDYWALGRQSGARVVTGGARPAHLERGYFVQPTIFDQVSPEMRIAREEIFGPVTVAIPFTDEDEALQIANDTRYGLAAGVFTADVGQALRIVRDLEAGIVWVNEWFIGGPAVPVGGYKESGFGREKGLPGIMNYLQIKNVGIRL